MCSHCREKRCHLPFPCGRIFYLDGRIDPRTPKAQISPISKGCSVIEHASRWYIVVGISDPLKRCNAYVTTKIYMMHWYCHLRPSSERSSLSIFCPSDANHESWHGRKAHFGTTLLQPCSSIQYQVRNQSGRLGRKKVH